MEKETRVTGNGRPRGTTKRVMVQFQLRQAEADALRELAVRRDVSQAAILRAAVCELLRQADR